MTTATREPESFIPLTPAVFHILLALVDGEKHGYAIMLEVEAISSDQIKMGPGTLYGSIKRMIANGLIEDRQESFRKMLHTCAPKMTTTITPA